MTSQQYSYKLVEDWIKKANEVDRKEFINAKQRNEDNTQNLTYVIVHNPRNKNITPEHRATKERYLKNKTYENMECTIHKYM